MYYRRPIEQRWEEFDWYSVSHSIFGVYMPEDNSADADAWRNELDEWGRWNGIQMVMDVKPIACDYASANCGELNISWQAFPACTNDAQTEYLGGILPHVMFGENIDKDDFYSKANWRVLSQMKYSIWRHL